jgi:hypothetical protein
METTVIKDNYASGRFIDYQDFWLVVMKGYHREIQWNFSKKFSDYYILSRKE